MYFDGRVQAVGRLPGAETHAANKLADLAGRPQRHRHAIAGQHIAVTRQATEFDLHALQRGVDIAYRAAAPALLAQHMPGLQGLTQFQLDALDTEIAGFGKAELEVRSKPLAVQAIAAAVQLLQHVGKILLDKVRQQVAVMQLGAPAHQPRGLVGFTPETGDQRANQQLLGQAHLRMGRHLEGAQLQQTKAPRGRVRRVQLVDTELGAMGVTGHVHQQVAQQAVDQPGLAVATHFRHLREGDFQLVQRIVTRLIDTRRLGRRADKQTAEQVGQRRMVVPVADQAAQQVRPAQKRRVRRRRAAEHKVVTAARASVAAIDHKFLAGEAALAGLRVEKLGAFDQLIPTGGRVYIHLDYAGVRSYAEELQARVQWRFVPLQQHRALHLGSSGFDGRHQFQIVFQAHQRRHK